MPMMRFEAPDADKEFQAAFGRGLDTLTAPQLLWLAKFAKHTRGRCRSNAALYSYFNRLFPNARFRDVPKEFNGRPYRGMEITVKTASGETKAEDDSESGEE